MASNKRDTLVDTALNLFYREGFHAVGIDRILAEAGVAKMTLYNHFRSKDELILSVLRRRDEQFRNWFMREVERRGETPRERLLAIFDVLGEWFETDDFAGCLFIKASAEYIDAGSAIRREIAEHKRLVLDYILELVTLAGAPDPAAVAAQIMILEEGAIIAAHTGGDGDAAQTAKAAADVLLTAAGV